MRLILTDDAGIVIDAIEHVEIDGLEIVNNTGGVSIAPIVRARLAQAIYPYWIESQKATQPREYVQANGGNVRPFKKP